MNKSDKAELEALKQKAYKILGNKCYIHGKKHKTYSIHHLWYIDEMTWKDFPDKLSYHKYLIPLVMVNPKRFKLLCGSMHYMVESFRRWNTPMLKRWWKLVRYNKK